MASRLTVTRQPAPIVSCHLRRPTVAWLDALRAANPSGTGGGVLSVRRARAPPNVSSAARHMGLPCRAVRSPLPAVCCLLLHCAAISEKPLPRCVPYCHCCCLPQPPPPTPCHPTAIVLPASPALVRPGRQRRLAAPHLLAKGRCRQYRGLACVIAGTSPGCPPHRQLAGVIMTRPRQAMVWCGGFCCHPVSTIAA